MAFRYHPCAVESSIQLCLSIPELPLVIQFPISDCLMFLFECQSLSKTQHGYAMTKLLVLLSKPSFPRTLIISGDTISLYPVEQAWSRCFLFVPHIQSVATSSITTLLKYDSCSCSFSLSNPTSKHTIFKLPWNWPDCDCKWFNLIFFSFILALPLLFLFVES